MNLPPPDHAILKAYRAFTGEVDQRMADLTGKRLPALRCGPGCCDCCIAFSVLPLEAAILQAGLSAEGRPALANPQKDSCVLLDDGLCRLYNRRPLLCRTQGLALAYIDEASRTVEVSACPVNFPADFVFEQEDLLFMDEFNSRLAELNLLYCRQAGLQPADRISLASLVGTP
ncbi:MAG: YkgJ family cysteine cluster protein [Desulfocapsaceae bacterium]|nr:YkgJ family cysteine cluster protein [Desulfocapsaceae bacterium]